MSSRRKPLPRLSPLSLLDPGGVLLSRAVASQVPSACGGLTSVFGMGTGGSLRLLPPKIFLGCLRVTLRVSPFSSAHHILKTAQVLLSLALKSSLLSVNLSLACSSLSPAVLLRRLPLLLSASALSFRFSAFPSPRSQIKPSPY